MIDWDRIDELRTEIGAEDFAEVADIFLEELDEVMIRLQAQPKAADRAEMMHFIKGCALNLGFAELARIAARGEHSARGDGHGDVTLADLLQVYGASRDAFLARFNSDAAA